MYFRILKNGLTVLGLRNSSSPSTYGYESLSSTTTEGPSPSSGFEISSEHVVWCTLLGLLLALLVKKGLTILEISQKIRPVKMITIKISNNYTIQTNLTSEIYKTAMKNHFVSFNSDFYIYIFSFHSVHPKE